MAISLNHTIVPARDKEVAARFFSRTFGLEMGAPSGAFIPVRVEPSLTFAFADAEGFEPHHYAFLVSEEELDGIFTRLKRDGISYSADPYGQELGRINHRKGGRGFYFRDPDGHILEVLTRG